LLDAEIRRAQAVTRQHFESLNAPEAPAPVAPVAEVPAPAVDPVEMAPGQAAPAAVAEPMPAEPELDLIAPLPPLSAPPRTEPEPAASPEKIGLPALMPVDSPGVGSVIPMLLPPLQRVPTEDRDAAPVTSTRVVAAEEVGRLALATASPASAEEKSVEKKDKPTADARPSIEGTAPSGGPSIEDNREPRPPLEIASLRLCIRVKKIGQVESVDPGALKPGQRLLVYWEMSGLEYRARGDAFVSRLAAHLELRSGTDGPVVWELAPRAAEDVSASRRRDYYASYPIELPRTLEPGPYRLRLIQTDLIGNRAASRELAVTVVR
jgi:hypothetical protein